MATPASPPKQIKIASAYVDRLGVLGAILADYAIQIAPFEAEQEALEAQVIAQFADQIPDSCTPPRASRTCSW